jgi:hypothetical protein
MKETLDKIVMDEERKDEIRNTLLQRKPAQHTWVKVAAAVAAVICAVMIIPFTRNKVLQAAENIFKPIRSKNGMELDLDFDENNNFVSATVNGEPKDYLKVVDDRLIFEINSETIDVTDSCSDEEFYRYVIKNDDGSCNVIYLGGTIERYGWLELIVTPDFFNNSENSQIGVWFTGGSASGNEMDLDEQSQWEKKAFEDGEKYMSSLY